MAVSPSQFDENLQEMYDYYEVVIDGLLVKEGLKGRGFISIYIPSRMTRDIWEVLKLRYTNAGVEFC